jgi:hypothetical protein
LQPAFAFVHRAAFLVLGAAFLAVFLVLAMSYGSSMVGRPYLPATGFPERPKWDRRCHD